MLIYDIQSGTYMAIIGHTGSGKSTLIQHLNGLLKPTKGRFRSVNVRLKQTKKKEFKSYSKKSRHCFSISRTSTF